MQSNAYYMFTHLILGYHNMCISQQGPFYHISRTTGPTHHTLLVAFASSDRAANPTIEMLPPVGGCDHGPLDSERVLEAVLEGVRLGNESKNTSFCVKAIQYVQNDNPPETHYTALAYKLVAYLVNNTTAEERNEWL